MTPYEYAESARKAGATSKQAQRQLVETYRLKPRGARKVWRETKRGYRHH